MTFVKTRLLIERMAVGETALVRLTGEEPIENVTASVTELGHAVLGMGPENPDNPEREDAGRSDIQLLHIRKNGPRTAPDQGRAGTGASRDQA